MLINWIVFRLKLSVIVVMLFEEIMIKLETSTLVHFILLCVFILSSCVDYYMTKYLVLPRKNLIHLSFIFVTKQSIKLTFLFHKS